MNRQSVLRYLTPVQGIEQDVVDFQDAHDIIREIKRCHQEWVNEYDKVAWMFWRGNPWKTCYEIWKFIKDNLPYRLESEYLQTVKSPAAILDYEKVPGGIDCKHYSLFSAGIIDALKRQGKPLDWSFVFVSTRPSDYPTHVFVECIGPNGDPIWLDGVEKSFNFKGRKYFYFKKIKINTMLKSISGLGVMGCTSCSDVQQAMSIKSPGSGVQYGGGNGYVTNPPGCDPLSDPNCTVSLPEVTIPAKAGLSLLEKVLLIGAAVGLLFAISKR